MKKEKIKIFKFNPIYDMNNVYSAYWDQINAGLSDHWFYSNSKNMNIVTGLYDHVVNYLQQGSDYCDIMMNGWIVILQEDNRNAVCLF